MGDHPSPRTAVTAGAGDEAAGCRIRQADCRQCGDAAGAGSPSRTAPPAPVLVQRLFGVTLAEAKAMLAVVRTQDQVEAALQAGVARTTLRTQLRQAYRRAGPARPHGSAAAAGALRVRVGRAARSHPQG